MTFYGSPILSKFTLLNNTELHTKYATIGEKKINEFIQRGESIDEPMMKGDYY